MFHDGVHLNERGARLAAEEIAEFFVEKDLLESFRDER
jgi:lysophospholipase L1-like esterase